jgi:hypothetical protein
MRRFYTHLLQYLMLPIIFIQVFKIRLYASDFDDTVEVRNITTEYAMLELTFSHTCN